ncbi:MAG TPA: RNHCP domain-containing protein [Streptosporangiaceae bacterium]|nr:RNHCP domain-containing protein [Streptosporangiaceae bacterium]
MCTNCGAVVAPLTNGSYRNHCPLCLWSMHVDVRPGDRASDCHGLMRPDRMDQRPGKGLVIIHRCVRCRFTRANRIASESAQSDDIAALSDLMLPGP